MEYLGKLKDDTNNNVDLEKLGERVRELREMINDSKGEFGCYVLGMDKECGEEFVDDLEHGLIDKHDEDIDDFIDDIIDYCKINRKWLYYGKGQKFNYNELLKEIDNYDSFLIVRYEQNRPDGNYTTHVNFANYGITSFCIMLAYLPAGERVRLIRKKYRLNTREFGQRLGVTATAISNIECGNRRLTEQMAKLISNEFGVNIKWLRTGEGTIMSNKNCENNILQNSVFKINQNNYLPPKEILLIIASVVKSGLENFSNDDLDALKSSASFLLSAVKQELSARENKQNNKT